MPILRVAASSILLKGGCPECGHDMSKHMTVIGGGHACLQGECGRKLDAGFMQRPGDPPRKMSDIDCYPCSLRNQLHTESCDTCGHPKEHHFTSKVRNETVCANCGADNVKKKEPSIYGGIAVHDFRPIEHLPPDIRDMDKANAVHGALTGHQYHDDVYPKGTVENVPTHEAVKYTDVAIHPGYEHEPGGCGNHKYPTNEAWGAFKDSIKEHGIGSPIQIEYCADHNRAIVGEGNHRLAAAHQLGISHVPMEVLRGHSFTCNSRRGYALRGAPRPDHAAIRPNPRDRDYVRGNMAPSDLGIPVEERKPRGMAKARYQDRDTDDTCPYCYEPMAEHTSAQVEECRANFEGTPARRGRSVPDKLPASVIGKSDGFRQIMEERKAEMRAWGELGPHDHGMYPIHEHYSINSEGDIPKGKRGRPIGLSRGDDHIHAHDQQGTALPGPTPKGRRPFVPNRLPPDILKAFTRSSPSEFADYGSSGVNLAGFVRPDGSVREFDPGMVHDEAWEKHRGRGHWSKSGWARIGYYHGKNPEFFASANHKTTEAQHATIRSIGRRAEREGHGFNWECEEHDFPEEARPRYGSGEYDKHFGIAKSLFVVEEPIVDVTARSLFELVVDEPRMMKDRIEKAVSGVAQVPARWLVENARPLTAEGWGDIKPPTSRRLGDSIARHGVGKPIEVWHSSDGYSVHDGHHRTVLAHALGQTVPVHFSHHRDDRVEPHECVPLEFRRDIRKSQPGTMKLRPGERGWMTIRGEGPMSGRPIRAEMGRGMKLRPPAERKKVNLGPEIGMREYTPEESKGIRALPHEKAHADDLLKQYRESSPEQRKRGHNWYPRASQIVDRYAGQHEMPTGKKVGYSKSQISGALAALSPRQNWGENVFMLDRLVRAHQHGTEFKRVRGLGFRGNGQKAWRILGGADPAEVLGEKKRTGQKVRAFHHALENFDGKEHADHSKCDQPTVIDNLMDRAMHGSQKPNHRPTAIDGKVYREHSNAVRVAAMRAGVEPWALQATVWAKMNDEGGKAPRVHVGAEGQPHMLKLAGVWPGSTKRRKLMLKSQSVWRAE